MAKIMIFMSLEIDGCVAATAEMTSKDSTSTTRGRTPWSRG